MAHPRLSYGIRSLVALGVLVIVTQSFHPLLLLPMQAGQTAGWLILLLAAIMATPFGLILAIAMRKIPGSDLIELAKIAFGRAGAIVTALLFAALFAFLGSMILRETSEMAISSAFPHTPQTFATSALLMGSVFVAYGDTAGLVRLGRVLAPVVAGALLLLSLGAFPWGRPQFITPFWGPGPVQLLLQAPAVGIFFAPANVLTILTRGINNRHTMVPIASALPLISGAILALVTLVLNMVMPFPLSVSVTYPLHAASRLLLGGRFFERLEGIWLFLWVMTTIVFSGALLHAASVAVCRAFELRKHTPAVLPLATVTMTLAFFPRNQVETVALHHAAAPLISSITMVVPFAASVVALIRWRRPAAP